MADGTCASLFDRIRRMTPAAVNVSDGQLLDRFLTAKDQAAFELLVWRHGAMVHNVCRRVLGREHDAEDAFQAVFLVLARKAASIGRRESVGSWLYRVAVRVALRARTTASKRFSKEKSAAYREYSVSPKVPDAPEMRTILDEELARLPAKYRAALVLCYLEGKTNEEAARELGCPSGTIYSRLARGRERLRSRLVRRGLAFATVATLFPLGSADAAYPATLAATTASAAAQFTQGRTLLIPDSILALTKGTLHTMWMTKLTTAAAIVLACGLMAVGVAAGHQALADHPAASSEPGGNQAELPVAPRLKADKIDPKKEMEKLKGIWNCEAMEVSGEAVPADVAKKLKTEFGGDTMTWHGAVFSNGKEWMFQETKFDSDFALDPNEKPKHIDIKLSNDKTVQGIYELDGDKLRICISYVGERPKEFTTKDKEGHILTVLKSAKK